MIIIFIILAVLSCTVSYYCGYKNAFDKALDMLDSAFEKKFKDAGVVVKKDDRIIECNGMVSDNCKKCIFGRQPVYNVIECFAPDFDGVQTIGLKRLDGQENCEYVDYSTMYTSDPPQYKCERYGNLVHMTDECEGGHNAEKQKEGKEA